MADFFEYQKRSYAEVGLSDRIHLKNFKEALNTLWKERHSFGLTSVFFEDEKSQRTAVFHFFMRVI